MDTHAMKNFGIGEMNERGELLLNLIERCHENPGYILLYIFLVAGSKVKKQKKKRLK